MHLILNAKLDALLETKRIKKKFVCVKLELGFPKEFAKCKKIGLIIIVLERI